jgi:hypothetical protein
MARPVTFTSRLKVAGDLPHFDEPVVKDEPMFFRSSREFARQHGGPIAQAFLDAIDDQLPAHVKLSIDTRVHMLMPGWWPCIPGWHHDDVPRERDDRQPEYENPSYQADHVLALVNGDVAPTAFALGHCSLPALPLGKTIYKEWNPEVEARLADGSLTKFLAPSNKLIWFDWLTLHAGQQAVARGWRWFGRASWNTALADRPRNEIRRQVQVYLENPMDGW